MCLGGSREEATELKLTGQRLPVARASGNGRPAAPNHVEKRQRENRYLFKL